MCFVVQGLRCIDLLSRFTSRLLLLLFIEVDSDIALILPSELFTFQVLTQIILASYAKGWDLYAHLLSINIERATSKLKVLKLKSHEDVLKDGIRPRHHVRNSRVRNLTAILY